MGIKSDRRELQGFFYFCVVFVIGNLVISVCDILHLFEDKIPQQLISIFGFFKLLCVFIIIYAITKIKEYSSGDSYKNIVHNLYIAIVNIVLLGYFIFVNSFRSYDMLAVSSAFNAFIFSIPMTLVWLTNKSLGVDRKIQWQRACGIYNECENKNTFLWRYKLSFSDIEKSFTRKDIINLSDKRVFGFCLIGLVAVMYFTRGMSLIYILILIKPVLFLLDIVFNLVSSIEGECTGCYRKTRGRSSNSYYYVYIVTNYQKKKEIKITSYDELLFGEGDLIKVYYTLFSKNILKYHPINYTYE